MKRTASIFATITLGVVVLLHGPAAAESPQGAVVSSFGHVCSAEQLGGPTQNGPEPFCTYASSIEGGFAGVGPFRVTARDAAGNVVFGPFECAAGQPCSTLDPQNMAGAFPIPAKTRVTAEATGPTGNVAVGRVVIMPDNLTATAVSAGQIDLSWRDNNTTESDFHIERSDDAGVTFTEIGTVASSPGPGGPPVVTFSDPTNACSQTRQYRVRAHAHAPGTGAHFSDLQFSDYSNVDADRTAPCIPAALTATAASASRIDLSWQDTSSTETEFHVERSANGASWTEIAVVPAGVTTFSDTALACGQTRSYRVRAHDHLSKTQLFSAYGNVHGDTTAPCASTGLAAAAISASRIDLSWTDASSTESEFHVERSADGIIWIEIGAAPANTTSFGDASLSCGQTRFYRVRGHDHASKAALFSGYSNTASATTSIC